MENQIMKTTKDSRTTISSFVAVLLAFLCLQAAAAQFEDKHQPRVSAPGLGGRGCMDGAHQLDRLGLLCTN